MTLKVYIGNRKNDVLDISDCVKSVSYSLSRVIRPGSADISFSYDKEINIENGCSVKVVADNQTVFYGYIFTVTQDPDGYSLSCFDQIRYLENEDCIIIKNKTMSQILADYVSKFSLKTGHIENTKHIIPSVVEVSKSITDILNEAMQETTYATNEMFTLYDENGFLYLENLKNMRKNIVLSGDSNMFGYTYTRDISSDTYNKFKLIKQSKDAGTFETFIAQDSGKIAKWGLLQMVQEVDEKYNQAQINQILDALPRLYGDEIIRLDVECLGLVNLRAGNIIYVEITDIKMSKWCLVDEISHSLEKCAHTMQLKLLGVA